MSPTPLVEWFQLNKIFSTLCSCLRAICSSLSISNFDAMESLPKLPGLNVPLDFFTNGGGLHVSEGIELFRNALDVVERGYEDDGDAA